MIQSEEVRRTADGWWAHSAWEAMAGDREMLPVSEVQAWLNLHALELQTVMLEDSEEDSPAYRAYYEHGQGLESWGLSPPHDEGWFLLCIGDSEDGPFQHWVRQKVPQGFMPYEAWRITYQDSEQAARAAYRAAQQHAARCNAVSQELSVVEAERNASIDRERDLAAQMEGLLNELESLRQPKAPGCTGEPPCYDLVAHMRRQIAFSTRAFGPGDRQAGVIDHIRKELKEIEAAPDDLEEWIDAASLALDGAWRAGHSAEEVAAGLGAKLVKNEGRDWPDWRAADRNKAIEHVRGASSTACDDQLAADPEALEEGRA